MSSTLKLTLAALLTAGMAANGQTPVALKDAFRGCFRVGAALNKGQFDERDARGAAIVRAQFNAISPETILKWESIHPQPDTYRFEEPDRYVAFGEMNHMFIVGHTLVWHERTPSWVFQDGQGNTIGRDALLRRMREHIRTVVGRYKGRIGGWDVVNEALNEDGTLRQSPWLKIIGDDYILKAFEFAHEADPGAELYYNEYELEGKAKRNGAVELIRKLKAQGIPVAAVGLQGHYRLDWPTTEQVEAAIVTLSGLSIKVNVTELDITVLPTAKRQRAAVPAELNPYTNGLPDAVQQALAQRYADLFGLFVKHCGVITRVTFWGVTDDDSWLNNWPVPGRTNYPLLFDRQGRSKPAFDAVIGTAPGNQR
jgi:endo-1,4-beta-xylanase